MRFRAHLFLIAFLWFLRAPHGARFRFDIFKSFKRLVNSRNARNAVSQLPLLFPLFVRGVSTQEIPSLN